MKRPDIVPLLDVLDELEAAATKGEWRGHPEVPKSLVSSAEPDESLLCLDADEMAVFDRAEDRDLTCALRNAAPVLLDMTRRCIETEERVVNMANLLRECEPIIAAMYPGHRGLRDRIRAELHGSEARHA